MYSTHGRWFLLATPAYSLLVRKSTFHFLCSDFYDSAPPLKNLWDTCEYFAPGEVLCPRCSSNEVVFYDHYKRRAMFLLRGYEKRHLVIKAKRYRCPHCGRVFREPIEGLKAWQRSSIDPNFFLLRIRCREVLS